jgi:signal transduction histidine kinase
MYAPFKRLIYNESTMSNPLRRLFVAPVFENEEETRVAQILNGFVWSAIGILLAIIIFRIIVWAENGYVPILVLTAIVGILAGGQIMIRRGYVRGASMFLVGALWITLTYQAWEADGIRDAAIFAYVIVIIFSSLLLGWRFASVMSGLSIVVIWYFAIMEKQGARILHVDDPTSYARDLSVVIILVGVLIYLLISNWSRTLRSARVELQERLRVEEKLRRQADYLAGLNETALGLLNRFELQPLLESILARACDLINTKHGLIELVLPDGSALRQEVARGVLSKYNGTLTLKNEGLAGCVWVSGEKLVVQDYVAWDKGLPESIEAGVTAVMGVPLKVSDTVIGVLAISYVEPGRTFTHEEINLMERFSALASLAIDNARLYEQAQQEIHERSMVEVELRASEARTRAVLASIPDMIFEISKDGTFLDFMASAEIAPLMPPSQFLGRNIKELFPTAIAAPTFFALERALETNQLHAFEYGMPPGEEVQFFEARITAITPESAIMMVRDISQRKYVQTEREKLINELEEKNGELERFTYTVSHDLKSPLITIKGFLGFLEQDAASGNAVRLKADIQRIANAADKMQLLLSELLELTRIGRLMNPYQKIGFEELVREAVDLVHGQIQSKEIQVSIQENLPMVYGDRRRLVEVIQNLLDNAAKFIGTQANPRIEIGQNGSENGKPIFYIKDNGIGIDLIHHDRIFGLFNKLDASSEGTGIGLALVKRIIEVHGGRIWIQSDLNKGATFFFTLQTEPAP